MDEEHNVEEFLFGCEREERKQTTAASQRNFGTLPRCAEYWPVLQKTIRHHQLLISSSYIERVNGYCVLFLASESCQRGALLPMRHVVVLNLWVHGAQNS